MDLIGPLIGWLDRPAPLIAARMRFNRKRSLVPALQIVDRLLSAGDIALDIGAAKGIYSAGMLDRVGRSGAVHAFEPHPAHVERLRAIARRARNFTLHEGALSDREGTAELMIPTIAGAVYTGMSSLHDPRRKVDAEIEVVSVSTRRLDDVLSDIERVDFIKCDVEGHEDEVLRGGEALLQRCRPAVLIEIEQRHRATDLRLTIEWLQGLDLVGYALFGDGLRPVEEFDLERDQLRHLPALDPSRPFPVEYVGDFVFVRPDTELDGLLGASLVP